MTMITPSYLGETIEYSSLHACRSTLEDPTCLVLIGDAVGKSIITIEGIAQRGGEPLQEEFVKCGSAQCGYCTPGMIVSAYALLSEQPKPTDDDIKFYLAGNICRCTGYNKITEAVRAAAPQMQLEAVPAMRRSS